MFRFIKKKSYKVIFILLTALVLGATYLIPKLLPDDTKTEKTAGNIEATFVDVGQGNSFMIRTSNNRTILIDGGEYSAFNNYLEPFLESRGIQKIDTAVVTHYHSDHMGGISKLVQNDMVEQLILPDYEDTDDSRLELETFAKDTETEILYASAGDKINFGYPGLDAKVLNPPKGGSEGNNFHNNSSMTLRITYGKTSILITGDIESRVEKSIIKSNDVECDILQVAHHGSSSSSSKAFIQATNPTYAIIPVGKDNSYGHPHYETLDTLEDEDATIYRTDTDGDITFTITPEKIEKIDYSK